MPIQYIPHSIRAIITYPVRLPGTIYQNLRLRPIEVIIRVNNFTVVVAPNNSYASVVANVAAVTPPLVNVGEAGLPGLIRANPERAYDTFSFLVPPGWFYRASTATIGAGSGSFILEWTEVEL